MACVKFTLVAATTVSYTHLDVYKRQAKDMKEAVRQSVEAGLNVRCTFRSPDSFVLPLRELVKEGGLSEEAVSYTHLSCSCDVSDLHTHFHCATCNKPFCFTNIPTPVVKLPQGFTLNSINYVLKGLCPDCAAEVNRCLLYTSRCV